MPRIIFIITYLGEYPWYFPYFLHSCRYNPTVDFLIFTDNSDVELDLPENVKIIPCSDELLGICLYGLRYGILGSAGSRMSFGSAACA